MDIGDIVYIKARGFDETVGEIIDLSDHDPRYSVAIDGRAGYRFKEKDMEFLLHKNDEEGCIHIYQDVPRGRTCSYCHTIAIDHILVIDLSHTPHHFYACPNHQQVWRYPDNSYE